MQIKIEIDVRPDELRRFLGLPDVAGLQDDVIEFLRQKIDAAGEFDATGFVKHNLETLRNNPTLQKLIAKVRIAEGVSTPTEQAPARKRRTRRAKQA